MPVWFAQGGPHRGVQHKAEVEQHLGGRQMIVHAAVVPAPNGVDDRALIVVLVLNPSRHLRRPMVLIVDSVAQQPHFAAPNVLIEGEVTTQP